MIKYIIYYSQHRYSIIPINMILHRIKFSSQQQIKRRNKINVVILILIRNIGIKCKFNKFIFGMQLIIEDKIKMLNRIMNYKIIL
jgi:hypothetical protein